MSKQKRGLAILLLFSVMIKLITYNLLSVRVYAAENDLLNINSPSAILIEANKGTIIYEKDADAILRPASITKIMTLILIFDALSEGKIALTDNVTVSEYAASMGGSQVYLEAGEIQTVNDMIKCISIASANDACVAMAEHIWGSEELFVQKMNERAKGLGMNSTTFVNCCGLDVDGHVTSARDVATMSRELITKYPEIHNYSTIWMDTITHQTKRGDSEFGLTNTNKLLKQYEGATGLKTGSTSLAGFCLSATANKNDIELIAVVMHASDGKQRVADCVKLLNYGYSIVKKYEDTNPPPLSKVKLKGGVYDYVVCEYKNNFNCIFLENYDPDKIITHQEMLQNPHAPIKKGDTLGMLVYEYNGKTIGCVDIVATCDVAYATFLDYLVKIFKCTF